MKIIDKIMELTFSEKLKDKIVTTFIWSICILAFVAFLYLFSSAIISNPDAGTFEINGVIIQSDLITDANDNCYTYITLYEGSTYLIYEWHTFKLYTHLCIELKESYYTTDYYFLKNWEVIE